MQRYRSFDARPDSHRRFPRSCAVLAGALGAALIFLFTLPTASHADTASDALRDLTVQLKLMQKQMQSMQRRIDELEAEKKPSAAASTMPGTSASAGVAAGGAPTRPAATSLPGASAG